MKVSLKTENEEHPGNAVQIRGSEGGRRSFTGTSMQSFRWHVPRQPSARLTHDLKLDNVVWLLRCSVFRETSMAFFCDYFKRLNCYGEPYHENTKGEKQEKGEVKVKDTRITSLCTRRRRVSGRS